MKEKKKLSLDCPETQPNCYNSRGQKKYEQTGGAKNKIIIKKGGVVVVQN